MSEINVLSKEELSLIVSDTTAYAFGKSRLSDKDKTFCKGMLSTGMGSIIKEKTILNFSDYEDDTALHGFDGFEKDTKRAVEIKTETFSDHGKTISKCSGTMNFGDNQESAYEKFSEQNPIISVTSFAPNGKVVATIEFDFADSTLEEEFKIYQERRQQDVKEGKNKNTSLSRNYKTFENAKSFRVRFYNSKYGDMLVGPYRKLIEATILSKNKQKLDSLDEKEINKMMSETLTLEKKKNILAMSLDNAMVA